MTRILAAAAALLALAPLGCGNGATDSGAVAVSMRNLRFHPASVAVRVGRSVTWTNDDAVDHNVTATAGATFRSQAFGAGKRYSFTPPRAGTIKYVCTLHPGMNGTLIVRR